MAHLMRSIALLPRFMMTFGGEDPAQPSNNYWYHQIMTWKAARAAGWSVDPNLLTVPFSNREQELLIDKGEKKWAADSLAWHADYLDSYCYNPAFWFDPTNGGGLARFKAVLVDQPDLVKLHFDDLSSTSQTKRAWGRYLGGAIAGLQWAANRDDVEAARHITGITLHALQDFYSHSNWVDRPERRTLTWPEAGTPSATDGSDPRDALHLYSGAYDLPLHGGFRSHGKFALDCAALRKLPVPKVVLDALVFGGIADVELRSVHPLAGVPAGS